MILRNKLTKETLNISHAEFRAMFSKEIQVALDSYIRTQNNKQKILKQCSKNAQLLS